jgi:hypothetical protein
MGRFRRTTNALAVGLIAGVLTVPAVAALELPHPERDPVVPNGDAKVPVYRTDGPVLYVCGTNQDDISQRVAGFPTDLRVANLSLWAQCQTGGYRTLQDAVNNVKLPGTTIKVLPGVYGTPPAPATPVPACASLPAVLSFEQQVACPNAQNVVAILGKVDLQIEGTGAKPEDVIVDGAYGKPIGVRADRSPGTYLRNFTAERTTYSAVYVMESNGFAIDRMLGRWTDGDGLTAYASDHGMFTECEAYGNSDAGISVVSTPDVDAHNHYSSDRYPIEVQHCDSHNNLVGFSGTAGDSVSVHDNALVTNSVGITVGSAAQVPGLPQNHARFEHNDLGDNNENYYGFVRDGTCAKPLADRGYDKGVVCPTRGLPSGTGVFAAGTDYDTWTANYVYANRYAGFVMSWVPGHFRGDAHVAAQLDTSHHNRVYGNNLGVRPDGTAAPNGMDFWWDGQGDGNCWQAPSSAGARPKAVPRCGAGDLPGGLGTARYLPDPGAALTLLVCSRYDLAHARVPSDCSWYGATGLDRIEVKYALAEAALLGLLLLVLWWRLLRGSQLAFGGVALGLAGLVAGVYGSVRETSPLGAIGLGLLGLGWFCAGVALRRRGRAALGWLTIGLGLFAALGAIDRALVPIPWIPAPPGLLRLLLELIWVPSAVVAAVSGRLLAGAPEDWPDRPARRPRRIRGPRDPLERFAAALRE